MNSKEPEEKQSGLFPKTNRRDSKASETNVQPALLGLLCEEIGVGLSPYKKMSVDSVHALRAQDLRLMR